MLTKSASIFSLIVLIALSPSLASIADPSSAYGRQASMSPPNTTSLILGGTGLQSAPSGGSIGANPGNGVYLSTQPSGNPLTGQSSSPYASYGAPTYGSYGGGYQNAPAAASYPVNNNYPAQAAPYPQGVAQAVPPSQQGYPTYGYTSSYSSMMSGDLVQRNSQLQGGRFPYRNGSKIATSNLNPTSQEQPKANEEVMAILNKANNQNLGTPSNSTKNWLDRVFHWDMQENMKKESSSFNQKF
ncbi:MAG: hypothetical protein SFT81_07915 [Candidatus Caenarcaniphilales bacterium]|nr:hypothetical protein [Candidatus Caenarcaniphilales bacterium]